MVVSDCEFSGKVLLIVLSWIGTQRWIKFHLQGVLGMSSGAILRVGTRGSLLARTQTQWAIDCLSAAQPDLKAELVIIRTTGDVHSQQGIPQPMSKGLFTRELEEALLAGDVDVAVHSLKDLPTEFPCGIELGAVTVREDPRDVLIGKTVADIEVDPENISIGTGSLRRAAQLRARIPGCHVVDLQGNVDTRLKKVEQGIVDCAVMAAAGLNRVGRGDSITAFMEPDDMLPAPAQGALGIEVRAGDQRVMNLIDHINSVEAEICVGAERAFLHRLESGCRAPVAALATVTNEQVTLRGRVISVDGSQVFEGTLAAPMAKATEIGYQLADLLLKDGAREVLQRIREESENHG